MGPTKLLEIALWWTGILVAAVLFVRAVHTGLCRKYWLFFSYLGWVLAVEVVRFYVISSDAHVYRQFYWHTQALSVIAGYCVILEAYRGVLRNYPGAQKIATTILLALLAIVVGKAYSHPFEGPTDWLLSFTAEVERDMRTVQGLLIAFLIAVILYYSIPVGRNLLGIIFGYTLFIGTNIINLALQSSLGPSYWTPWRYLQSASYFVALLIWCITLWSPQADPKPEAVVLRERDYGLLASRTSNLLSRVRNHIVRPFGR